MDGPSSDDHSAFGQALAEARTLRGWSVGDAAQRAGINWKTWNRLEAGHPARPVTIRALERAFGVGEGVIAQAYHGRVPLQAALAEAPLRAADEPTVDQVFALARRLSVNDLRRLHDLVGGAIAVLSGPDRQRALERAAAAGMPYYERWRRANLDAELAHRAGDVDGELAAQKEIVRAKEDLEAWLHDAVPGLTHEEFSTVLVQIQKLA